jgi:hypothetical protein
MSLEKTVTLKVESKSALERLEDVERQLEQIGDATDGANDATKKTTKSISAMGLGLKALGIGAIISAITFLADKFSENQVVMDKVAQSAAVVGDIFNKLSDVVVSIIDGLGLLGRAVGKVLKGEFREAADLAKQSFDGVKESVVGNNESFADFIKNAKESAKETVAFAKNLIKLKNEVKLADAQQRQLQLTFQKEAEIQRQIRDDISLTFEERIAANEELGKVLDQQFAEEQALAQKKVELAELELSRNKDNIDLQVALIDAKTELADLDERITGQRSEQLTNLKALEKEQADSIQTSIDLKKKEADDALALEKKKADDQKKIVKDRIAAVKAMEISGAQSRLSAIGQLAGEGTAIAKATALTQILINSAQAVSGAIKAGAGIPFPANLGAIATGVGAVLSGIASAKNIFKKAGGTDAGGTESVNIDSSTRTETAIQGLGNLIPNVQGIDATTFGSVAPVQAYVVENDISNAQALQEELDIQATL